MSHWLLKRFASAPDRVAFATGDDAVTYGGLLELVAGQRAALDGAGVGVGDLVAVVGDLSPSVFALMLAIAERGATAIPLTRHSVIEIDTALAVSGHQWRTFSEVPIRHV